VTLIDEWNHNPTAIAEAFQAALDKRPKGNPPETIDYSNLTVGEEVNTDEEIRKS